MGAVVLDHGVKPEQWGLDPGLIAPEWDWFWEKVAIAIPLWEGGGDSIFSGQSQKTGHTIAATEGPTWEPGEQGHLLRGENPDTTVQTDVWDTGIPLPSGLSGWTCIAGVTIGASDSSYFHLFADGSLFTGTSVGIIFGVRPIDLSGGFEIMLRGRSSGTFVGSNILSVGPAGTVNNAIISGTVNGLVTAAFYSSDDIPFQKTSHNPTDWTITPSGNNIAFMGSSTALTSSSRAFGDDGNQTVQFAYCFFEVLSDEEVRQVHDDPGGPFRIRDEAFEVYALPAVGGLSIPVAMHNYRRQRAA